MLGPWVPSARYPLESERLLRFARQLAHGNRLTLAFATDAPDRLGTILALRAEFQDMEFAVVPRRLRRLWSALRLCVKASVDLTYHDSAALRARLRDRERSSRFDVIYAASAGMIQQALDLKGPAPLVLDFGDLDSAWWERRAAGRPRLTAGLYRAEAARVRAWEQAAARRATVCIVSSIPAAEQLTAVAPGASVVVVPNGVDPERYPAGPRRATEPIIAFTGCLECAAGLEAATEICRVVLPAVRASVADARVVIPSRYLPRPARHLARLPGVEIVGNGGDLRAVLRHAAVAVSPAGDADGAHPWALEAMAAGVPLVASRQNLNGLGAALDHGLYVEHDPGALARCLVELLGSESLRAEVGDRGRAFVRTHYSWDAAALRVAHVVDRVRSLTLPAGRWAAAPQIPVKP